ncbi:MAG: membrane dipeptidase [Gemmatimonadota bacterium]|jgi:microsomal dipeptidase-like Zn-dependent dipeptidase
MRAAALIVVFVLVGSAPPLAAQWTDVDGDAADIAVAADGEVWVLDTQRLRGGGVLQRWTGLGWENLEVTGSSVAADPNGRPWVITEGNLIYRWDGSGWQRMPGMAGDIAVGADGTVWAINVDPALAMDAPMRWTGREWENMSGSGVRIAVDDEGNAWIVTQDQAVYRWNGTTWENVPGEAQDIAVGPDGTVMIVGTEPVLGGWQVMRYTGSGWEALGIGGRRVALGPDGDLWVAFNDGRLRRTSMDRLAAVAQDDPADGGRQLTVSGGVVAQDAVQTRSFMYGFVDMRAHPMAQLAFGGELFHGAVDGDPATALGPCKCYHRGWDAFENTCGNLYRENLVNQLDIAGHETGDRAGYPTFSSFPKYNAILHQQMYVDWIRRARDGGLRAMVALAENSHMLADAGETEGTPNDDLGSMEVQIRELKAFAARHDWMEIAYSPADMRRIVEAGNLAIIIGVDTDNLGNFYDPADRKGASYVPEPTNQQIAAEIDRLYSEGVRYVLPIGKTNNAFGGTALYDSGNNVANKYNTGEAFQPEAVDAADTNIAFKLQSPYAVDRRSIRSAMAFGGTVIPRAIMPDRVENYPNYSDPGPRQGHRNSLGLTDRGRFAIRYMMSRGMMIDIDHMSERAVTEVLNMALLLDMPVNSGNNNLRKAGGNENQRTPYQYMAIRDVGGMVGVGHTGEASRFLRELELTLYVMEGANVAIGTDANGLVPLPGPPSAAARVEYGPSLTRSVMGTKTWDYNRDGVAHYGLLPDFIESLRSAGMHENVETAFFRSAEYFARMWEKVDQRAARIEAPPTAVQNAVGADPRGQIAGSQAGGAVNRPNAAGDQADTDAAALERLLREQARQGASNIPVN